MSSRFLEAISIDVGVEGLEKGTEISTGISSDKEVEINIGTKEIDSQQEINMSFDSLGSEITINNRFELVSLCFISLSLGTKVLEENIFVSAGIDIIDNEQEISLSFNNLEEKTIIITGAEKIDNQQKIIVSFEALENELTINTKFDAAEKDITVKTI